MKPNLLLLGVLAAGTFQIGHAQHLATFGIPASTLGRMETTCSDRAERCLIPVYVSTQQIAGVYFCTVRIDVGKVLVPRSGVPGKKIRVVWMLVDEQLGDQNEYRFHPTQGIAIVRNNVTKDFNTPGDDNRDRRRFKWDSVHANTTGDQAFMYALNVQRYVAASDSWAPCGVVDPIIINTN